MNIWKELLGYSEALLDRVTEKRRKKVPEPRVWVLRITGSRYELVEQTLPPDIPHLAVALGLTESKTESDKLIKQKGMEIRPWDCSTPWRKVSLREQLEPGVPMILRRGKSYYALKTMMRPLETQSFRFWKQLLEGEINAEAQN